MPTLLQINVSANYGSTGKIAEAIGESVIGHGWESSIAYGRVCRPSQSEIIKIGNKLDNYLHYGEQRIWDNEGLGSRKATRKLIRRINDIQPDVIQLHNLHDHYINYKLLFEYLNSTQIKVVWTFHDCWAFTGHCFHFVTANCEKWKTGCEKCPLNSCYPRTFLDNSTYNWNIKKSIFSENKNLTVVACSNWIANFVRESFLQDKRIEVIHNGIDLNQFKSISKKNKFGDNIYKIIAVSGIWYKEKGEQDVYKLRELLPKSEFEIIMVGLTEKQINKLPKGIKGIQRTQNINELVKLYSDADVLINPTYHDTFPTVNLEALACGTPVVTYKTGGSPEAIDEKTGIVVKQGDIISLANTIKELRNHPLLSADCRIRAEQFFDKNRCFDRYYELYEDLLKVR